MVISITPDSDISLNGVISFLKKKSDINDFIEVFASESQSTKDSILTQTDKTYFSSDSQGTGIFVGLKLLHHSLILKYFTIVQYDGLGCSLLNWKLQGSNSTSDNWVDLYTENGDKRFCVVGTVPTFAIPPEKWSAFSSFRIINTGKDCSGNIFFRFSHIEMFGILNGPFTRIENSYAINSSYKPFVFILLFTLP